MALSDITHADHVLAAIAEFDELGRAAFLSKYGFSPSRTYWLVHNGKRYDSKPIIGAAHRFARPDLGPLRFDQFSGGDATVKHRLEGLGFEVESPAAAGSDKEPGNFLLTWKETGWPHHHIVRMRNDFERQGWLDEPWRLRASRLAKPGDRAWVLRQGRGEKGIFAVGSITAPPERGEAVDGKQPMMAGIRFHSFVDPEQELLIPESIVRGILTKNQIEAQSSGLPITHEQASRLLEHLPAGTIWEPPIAPDDGDKSPYDPDADHDIAHRTMKAIRERRGQSKFRIALLAAYGRRCAISGCEVVDVLEAAHIDPYRGESSNAVDNGLLLRADLHTLFDLGHLSIHPETRSVIVADQLRGTEYEQFHAKPLRPPQKSSQAPSTKVLAKRYSHQLVRQ